MSTTLAYQPQLDGLRGIALVAVVLYHTNDAADVWFKGGYIAVDVFFVLSGFLITTLITREFARHGEIDMKSFYLRRVRRLAPALLLVCAFVLVVWAAWTGAPARNDTLLGVPASLFYVACWIAASGHSLLGHMGVTWSLSVEEHFYVLWPLAFIFALRRNRAMAFTVVATALSFVYYAVVVHVGWSATRLYYAPDTRTKDILIGCTLAVVLERWPMLGKGRIERWLGLASGLFLLAWVAVIEYGLFYLHRGTFAVLVASTVLVGTLFQQPTSIYSRFLSHRVWVWLGVRSYGIYLWHFVLFAFTDSIATALLLAFPATLLVSDLSYRYVELPIRARGWVDFAKRKPVVAS